MSDQTVLIGGIFDGIDGNLVKNFARLNHDGSLINDFNFESNGWIYGLSVTSDEQSILIHGNFSAINNQQNENIGLINQLGTSAESLINFSLSAQDSTIKVFWEFNEEQNNSDIESLHIEFKKESEVEWHELVITDLNITSLQIENLELNHIYEIRVRFKSNDTFSDFSLTKSVYLGDQNNEEITFNLSIQDSTKIIVNWFLTDTQKNSNLESIHIEYKKATEVKSFFLCKNKKGSLSSKFKGYSIFS